MRRKNSADKRSIRAKLCLGAKHCCSYCSKPTSMRVGTIDHYVPQALGGANAQSNLRWSCVACNREKADTHPDRWEFVLEAKWKALVYGCGSGVLLAGLAAGGGGDRVASDIHAVLDR